MNKKEQKREEVNVTAVTIGIIGMLLGFIALFIDKLIGWL